jgi:hypothetical protein
LQFAAPHLQLVSPLSDVNGACALDDIVSSAATNPTAGFSRTWVFSAGVWPVLQVNALKISGTRILVLVFIARFLLH